MGHMAWVCTTGADTVQPVDVQLWFSCFSSLIDNKTGATAFRSSQPRCLQQNTAARVLVHVVRPLSQVMVWKTNFDRLLENYATPLALRASQSAVQLPSEGIGQLSARQPLPPQPPSAATGSSSAMAGGGGAGFKPSLPVSSPAPPRVASASAAGQAGGARSHPHNPQQQQQQQDDFYGNQQQQRQPQRSASGYRPPISITSIRPPTLEYEAEVPPPLNLSDLPDSLSATLQVRGRGSRRLQVRITLDCPFRRHRVLLVGLECSFEQA